MTQKEMLHTLVGQMLLDMALPTFYSVYSWLNSKLNTEYTSVRPNLNDTVL